MSAGAANYGRVLFLADQDRLRHRWQAALEAHGFASQSLAAQADLFDTVDRDEIDVVVCDAQLGGSAGGGIELCRALAARRPNVRFVLHGPAGSFDALLDALRAGAFDYMVEPLEEEPLLSTLHRAVRDRELRQEVRRLRQALVETTGFGEIVGSSQPMQRLFEDLEQAAGSNASILITGESGTGKELVARALHERSRRRQGPFVAINCSALPETLLESELFGHVKGAFTDAKATRSGLFIKANGGTLFLDEIGDLPLPLQPKLLRSLQERAVRPIGSSRETPFDVRVIAATNCNLEAAVEDRTFRADLYYRLNVIHLEVPSLRDRAHDILAIAQHFVEHFSLLADKKVVGISPGAAEKLLACAWPGNVRELKNCIERAVAFCRSTEIQANDLPEKIRNYQRSHVLVVSNEPAELVTLDEVERRYILRVLESVRGNKREAARILGVDRKTLYRKLARYGLPGGDDKSSKPGSALA